MRTFVSSFKVFTSDLQGWRYASLGISIGSRPSTRWWLHLRCIPRLGSEMGDASHRARFLSWHYMETTTNSPFSASLPKYNHYRRATMHNIDRDDILQCE